MKFIGLFIHSVVKIIFLLVSVFCILTAILIDAGVLAPSLFLIVGVGLGISTCSWTYKDYGW